MTHPLKDFEIQGVNIKCFDEEGSGFFRFAPVSVVIGKNNAGKSTVVDLVEICTERSREPFVKASQKRGISEAAVDIRTILTKDRVATQFRDDRSGGFIGGNHGAFGRQFVGEALTLRYSSDKPNFPKALQQGKLAGALRPKVEEKLSRCSTWSLVSCTLLRVAAERSVIPESSGDPKPHPNGDGITNLIRYFINNDAQPRDAVEVDLLKDLNAIYTGDSNFRSIICQENDRSRDWEIFLREEGKGDVRLSESGSSLQSVFIILAYFRLVPLLENIQWEQLVLAIEEPENNLHPALLRRLITFLAEKREELGFSLVMTTHSPVCIDWATGRENSGILHVTREGARSKCRNVLDYDGRTNILDDLDVRGSDILQSNGIIWVEGPSDRVYLRRWLDLVSENELVEGSHYTFMYYGGKILSHFEAVPEAELSTLISMVTLNRNLAIVIDSDRRQKPGATRKPPMRIGETKKRLIKEVAKRGGFSWVTAGKEIENYTPIMVWKRLIGDDFKLEHDFVDIPSIARVKAIKSTKVALAHKVVENFGLEDLENHLDLKQKLEELVVHIKRWNSLD